MGTFAATEVLTPTGMTIAALLSLRIGGLLWVAPVFSSRSIPVSTKAALTVLLIVVLWRPPSQVGPVEMSTTAVLSELLVGMTLGLGAGIFVAAAESAGDMLAVQMGLSGANVVDPMSETQLPVLGQFLALFVTSLLVATGGHIALLRAIADSHEVIPTGGAIAFSDGIWSVVRLGGRQLWLGLRFAAPVIAAMMVGNVALGIMARAVPQLNVLMVAFPLQIGVGLFVLALTLPLIALAFQGWSETYRGIASDLLTDLTPRPGDG